MCGKEDEDLLYRQDLFYPLLLFYDVRTLAFVFVW